MHAEDTEPPSRPPETRSRRWQMILSYVVAGACLAWVLYNVHPRHFLRDVRQLKWQIVLLAIAVDNANYLSLGIRWSILLRPIARIRVIKAIQATYVALFTSNVLPMRFGEIVRAYLVSKWCSKKFSEIVPSMVLEHLFEGVWLALGIGMATVFLPMPAYVERGAEVFGVGVILLAVFFFWALLRKHKPHSRGEEELRRKLTEKIGYFIKELSIGMKRIGISPRFFIALGLTLFSLICQVLALWLVATAYGIKLAVWRAAVVLVIIRVGVVIPSAPANLGAYQFFAAMGMELLGGVGRTTATGFALILFFVLMTPTWITGFFALSKSGTTLFRLQHEARDAAKSE
jgi:glycosyltransferase 2 family protein